MDCSIQTSADIASVCDSPQLFAAYHVFRRLLMPRHSPCALLSLTLCLNWFSFEFQIESHFWLSIRQYCSFYPLISNIKGFVSQYLFAVFVFLLCSVFKVLFSTASCEVVEFFNFAFAKLVGSNGLEPSTSRLSGVRSNHLSYEPSR